MELTKRKPIKLKGKKARELYEHVYERDGGTCVNCGAYIPFGLKEHHEPCGIYKSDEPNKTCMLCETCHFKRHNDGKESGKIRDTCVAYLQDLYGEAGARKE